MKKHLEVVIPILVVVASMLLLWAYLVHKPISKPTYYYGGGREYGPNLPEKKLVEQVMPQKPGSIPVEMIERSPEIFAYAHGSVLADGKIFLGMAARSGNPFPTNQLYVFTNLDDLKEFRIISIRKAGDIESMVYDELNDKIYFTLSNNGSLDILRIDPKTYFVSTVISSSSVNIGLKPAITTDGRYIYGISYTDPSVVFKVGIYGNPLFISTTGHIPNGHSAAIGAFGSSTELYFGGGEADGFEKVDGDTLLSYGSIKIPGCSLTDDMPYQAVSDTYGYVYVGCERQPYGYRIKTDDLSTTRFPLPGRSFGMFIYGDDLYNAAQDGNYDLFKSMDIGKITRYGIGSDIQLNELFVASTTVKNILFTGWWGVKGLFKVGDPTR